MTATPKTSRKKRSATREQLTQRQYVDLLLAEEERPVAEASLPQRASAGRAGLLGTDGRPMTVARMLADLNRRN
jgi:hypothetical protein